MSKRNVGKLLQFFDVLSKDLEGVQVDEQHKQYAVRRLQARMRKRARLPSLGLKERAFDKFTQLNEFVGSRPLQLTSEEVSHARDFIFHAICKATSTFSDVPQDTDVWPYVRENWRYGPGVSFGIPGGLTHTAEKISAVQTVTQDASALYKLVRQQSGYTACFDALRSGNMSLVRGSSLFTVPKNEDSVRTCAKEPLGNMAMQLGLGSFFELALRLLGLNIRTQQPKNQFLARLGSLDGSLATLDLTSASDLIGCDLIEELYPPEVWKLISRIRSPEIYMGEAQGWMTLNMVSTMGNGFTFPLMTLTLLALVYASRASEPGRRNYIDWTCTAVYGDDIIVRTEEFERVCSILSRSGFIVSAEKSFSTGQFRESCGGDFFDDYDVTPFYVKSLSRDPEVYVALNQVTEWCSRHDILLPNTLRYLVSLVDDLLLVPEWAQPDSGWRCAQAPRSYRYLQPKTVRSSLELEAFLVPLAIGGYLTSTVVKQKKSVVEGTPVYTPRPLFTKYRVRKGRIPTGWLDGWDPGYRSRAISARADFIVSMLK